MLVWFLNETLTVSCSYQLMLEAVKANVCTLILKARSDLNVCSPSLKGEHSAVS